MLTKRRCTATGVINFFARHEPHIAVGSAIPLRGPAKYLWHYHGDVAAATGTAADLSAVERLLNEHHRRARRAEADDRQAA